MRGRLDQPHRRRPRRPASPQLPRPGDERELPAAPDRPPRADAPAAHAAQQPPITGSGTNESPYTAECTDPQNVDCTTPLFAARSLTDLWANKYVPAYKCPASHPYMYNQSYTPQGTVLPPGVGVLGLGPIGMNITGVETEQAGNLTRPGCTRSGP